MDVRRVVAELGAGAQGLVTASQLRAAGVSDGSLARAVAAGRVLRVHRAVYSLAALPPRPRFLVTDGGASPAHVAHVRAALMSLGSTATACARTAAVLRGWGLLVEPERRLDVAVPHGRSTVALTVAAVEQRRHLSRCLLTVLPGTDPLWVSSSLQTVVDCALRLSLIEAVVVCDSALRAHDVTLEELQRCSGRLSGQRQAHRLGQVLALADGRSGSVLESVGRVRMVQGGISGMELQVVLRAVPELRVDFCHRAARLVVELDGRKWHTDPVRDQARDNALATLGWRVLRFSWTQVVHQPELMLSQIRQALAAGGLRFQQELAEPRIAA